MKVEDKNSGIEASVTLTNTGDRAGKETVQFYMQDVTASLVRPVKELKGFEKVCLEPGESKTVCFWLEKKDMGFWNNEHVYCLEDGVFRFYAGGSSGDCLMAEAEITF